MSSTASGAGGRVPRARGSGGGALPAAPSVTSSGNETATGPGLPSMAIACASAAASATSCGVWGSNTALVSGPQHAVIVDLLKRLAPRAGPTAPGR